MANIIKLDEYLEKHRYSIVKAITDALGMNVEDPNDIQHTLDLYNEVTERLSSTTEQHQLEMDIVAALEAKDREAVKDLLQISDVDTWEGQTFDGVDIVEGFNYRCEMRSEASRNGLMDWLEENSLEYLIDNDGNFAIKCPSRKQHYHVNRYVESLLNKWDRPSFGKSVDPDIIRKGLGNISRPALSDGMYEGNVVQGPWKKKDPRDHTYEPVDPMTPELTKKMTIIAMSDEELFDHAYRALETEMTLGQSGGNIDVALDYIVSGYESDQNKILQGMRNALKDRYEEEFGQEYGRQQAWKHGTVGKDTIVRDEGLEEDAKDNLFPDTTHSASPFTDIDDEDEEDKKKNESIMEGKKKKRKKTAKQREKEAKEKLDSEIEASKAAAEENPASALSQGQFQAKTIPDKKKKDDKEKARKKVTVEENDKLDESVLGILTQMPTLGRIKELAGIPGKDCGITPDEGITTIIVKPDPGTPKIRDLPGVAEAKELITKAFDIYNTLPEDAQNIFKDYMISNMMGKTVGLKENIEELVELQRVDKPSKPMTDDDRIHLSGKIKGVKDALIHLIDTWASKTTEVTKLEPIVVLLNNMENKVGHGLV